MSKLIKRWVLTFVNSQGMRIMAHANDGRKTFDNKKDVYKWMSDMYKNTSKQTIKQVYGDKPRFKAVETECYPSLDSSKTVFDYLPQYIRG